MNCKLKVEELEAKVKEIFGEKLISLSASCAALKKTLSRKELGIFCSFSKSEDQLRQYAKDGFCLITIPKKMTIQEICLLVPKLFIFGECQKIIALKSKIIYPGRYLVRREPKELKFGGIMMRENAPHLCKAGPEVAVVICAYALCHLSGKSKLLAERIYISCREEIESRFYGKMHICFQKNLNKAFEIGIRISQMPIPNFLQIEKV